MRSHFASEYWQEALRTQSHGASMTDEEIVDCFGEDHAQVIFCLRAAAEWGLECEVVYSALEVMKANPTVSIAEAINGGCMEWDV